MKYDLSIIVPIYNVEDYLDQAVLSLLNQKEFSYEIVLVNDGSKDGCPAICEKYAKEYPDRVQVVNKPNGGLPSARKAGVQASRGEYVTFLDGDDWVDNDYYYNMLMKAKNTGAEIVCSGYKLSYPDKEFDRLNAVPSGVYLGEKLKEIRQRVLYNRPYYTYGIMPSLCMKVIEKSCIEEYIYKVPDEVTLAEDAACTYPILFSCNKLVVINENTGYHYRQIPSSMSWAYDTRKINRVTNVMDYMETALAPYYQTYKTQIDMFYTQLIKELVKNELLGEQKLADKKAKISILLQKEYCKRTLQDLSELPRSYRIFFWMLRERKFAVLNIVYTIFKKVRNK